MKKLPLLSKCFKCNNKVYEFEDNLWGCDTCKSIWTFKGRFWVRWIDSSKKSYDRNLIKLKM